MYVGGFPPSDLGHDFPGHNSGNAQIRSNVYAFDVQPFKLTVTSEQIQGTSCIRVLFLRPI